MLRALQLLVKLVYLAVSEIKFLLSTLYVGEDIVVWLVSALKQPFVKLDFSVAVFNLMLKSLDLLKHTFSLFLLLLKSVGQKQTLLNSAFRICGCLRDSLDKCIANIKSPISSDCVVLSHVHDCLIKLFLDHFVISETLSGHSKLCLYISIALACLTLKLVVL